MKKLYLILILSLFSISISAQNEFITIWKPSNESAQNILGGVPSTSTQIWFPGIGNNFNVYWEEIGFPLHNGTLSDVTSTVNFLIDFGVPQNPVASNATYKVKISNGNGNFTRIKFPHTVIVPLLDSPPIVTQNSGDTKKIIDISQWGNISWNTMAYAFYYCTFLNVSATDSPDLSNLNTTEAMFFSTGLVGNSSFSSWNTSTITNMGYMFGQTPFNQPIGNWDVSNVTDMRWMFHACELFNQPLNNWNTSNVTRMDHVFHYCTTFNQDLSNWKTSKVTHFDLLFGGANLFNQNLGDWDLSSVINGMQMLGGTNLDCNNWDKTLFGWANNPNSPSNFILGSVTTTTYSHPLAVTARNTLLNIKGWSFSGDVYDPSCESVLSTSETILKSKISIYPNPATDFIYLKNSNQSLDYSIFELSGKIVLQGSLNNNEINIKNLSKGNYILQVKTKDGIENFKFIKK